MSIVGLVVLSLALGLAAWLLFMWSVKSGQYDDPEGPKYRMLDDEDEAPRPAGGGTSAGGAPDSATERDPEP